MEMRYKKGRAWIEIDMSALRHNVTILQSLLPEDCELMPAVKANAYGHGAVAVAQELNRMGIRAFCVATAEEGAELRRHGVSGEILILGYTHPQLYSLLYQHDLSQSVVSYEDALRLNAFGKPIHVHIAVDTGMHRIGEPYTNIGNILRMLQLKNLQVDGLFTHLSADDSLDENDIRFTDRQAAYFFSVLQQVRENGFAPKAHLLGSYGLINYPQYGGAYARVGILLYGVRSSNSDYLRSFPTLRPVLSVRARIASIKDVHSGEYVGYSNAYQATSDRRIAVLTIGYADGIPRSLSCGVGKALIAGKAAPVVGRICMDQMMVDVTDIPEVCEGDIATLLGADFSAQICAEELALQSGSITNEILSRLGARLPRVLLQD